VRSTLSCLVHEAPECVADLVDNLRFLDPDSQILLYDGSKGQSLLRSGVLPSGEGVFVHPDPHEMAWGSLHGFALDCMEYAIELLEFDALTIVDSDQLAVRPEYSRYLSAFLSAHPNAGCLASDSHVQGRMTRNVTPRAAWREVDLWRPFLRRFPDGEAKFPHWTYWPATVFTRQAATELVRLFDDADLQRILRRSKIWASEEIILPTLVALAGLDVLQNPCSHDYVRYRVRYTASQIGAALRKPDVFWVHPVPRRYDDPLRARIRRGFNGYVPVPRHLEVSTHGRSVGTESLRPLEILDRMQPVEGWLTRAEAKLLLEAAVEALTTVPAPRRIVEVGSYCGRSTVVLGSVAQALDRTAKVFAVDPHEGVVGAAGRDLKHGAPTFDRFVENVAGAALEDVVEPIRQYSFNVTWDQPISLLFVDGLHHYAAVASDYSHFDPWLAEGSLVAFHDYADYYAGVKTFVDQLVAGGFCEWVRSAQSMVVLRKLRALGAPSIRRILDRSEAIEGWLEPDEAALLAVMASTALSTTTEDACVVELGSYCGRGTVVLGDVVVSHPGESRRRISAIDSFDGTVGAVGVGLFRGEPTLDRFKANLKEAGLEPAVDVVQGCTSEVPWDRPIAFLLVDGLHDYPSVAADFRHFRDHIVPGGLVAFHDFAGYYPGVKAVVGEVLRGGGYRQVALEGTLVVLQKEITEAGRRGAQPTTRKRADRRELTHRADRSAPGSLVVVEQPGIVQVRAPQAARAQEPDPALVSCIMPTYNRRRFVPQAIAYFLRQDYASRELVVVDDGDDAVEDLMPDDDRIRYLRLDHRLSIGSKRNLACEQARGEILVHWDDDDWSASWRISYQVGALLGADVDVSGSNNVLFWDPDRDRAWRYVYPSRRGPWVHDPTFCYRRAFWRTHPFPDTSHGIDTKYLWRSPRKRIGVLDDTSFYVGIVHGANTSPKRTAGAWWKPLGSGEIRDILGADADAYLHASGQLLPAPRMAN
jgi:predicted O-methyltransferase YrrM